MRNLLILIFLICIHINLVSSSSNSNHISRSNSNYNNNNNEDDNTEGNSNSASIQYMITQRMRRVLEDELRYLPEEVDIMEPQIASVVIERNLSRPSNGMPASWRRTDPSDVSGGKSIQAFFKSINSLSKKFAITFGSAAKKFFPAAIPIVLGYYLIPMIGDALAGHGPQLLTSINTIRLSNPFTKSRSFDSIDNDKKLSRKRNRANKGSSYVDMETLNKVTKLSPLDAAALNMKKKFKL